MKIYNIELSNRIILGSSGYTSPKVFINCIKILRVEMVTVAIRRLNNNDNSFLDIIKKTKCHVLPNTAGCLSPKDAIVTAEMSREIFETNLIKLEVIKDDLTLEPCMKGTIKAAETLTKKGFKILPYITDNLKFAKAMKDLGCKVVMPWGSHIGSGRGLDNQSNLIEIRKELPETTLIIDAGIGRISHACQAFEIGYDGILLNTAVAKSDNPEQFCKALDMSIKAVELSIGSGLIAQRKHATASSSNIGVPFKD